MMSSTFPGRQNSKESDREEDVDAATLVSVLNRLIRSCQYALGKYGEAIEAVDSSRVRRVLHRLELQRATFNAELKALVEGKGGQVESWPPDDPAVDGGWPGYRDVDAGRRDDEVVTECLTSEKAALAGFREALVLALPRDVRSIVERQRKEVQGAVATLDALLRRRRLGSQKGEGVNWDQMQGRWKQVRGDVQRAWGKLTGDDVDLIEGDRDKFVGKVQERYGIEKEEAERRLNDWLDSL